MNRLPADIITAYALLEVSLVAGVSLVLVALWAARGALGPCWTRHCIDQYLNGNSDEETR